MKTKLLFSFLIAICLLGTACKDESNDVLENITGTIIDISTSCSTPACSPDLVLGLETMSGKYILTINSCRIESDNKLIIENVRYFIGDKVEIKGTAITKKDVDSNKYTEFEIKTIKRLSLSQNIQRFLGEYHLEGTCKVLSPWQEEVAEEQYVTIKLGVESDLLIFDYNAFILNDSLFIPLQWRDIYDGTQASFQGKGKIENDSLFLHYGTGGSFGVVDCECKGEKFDSSVLR